MERNRRAIEIDEDVAIALEARAAERGVSISELVADLAAAEREVVLSPEELEELNARIEEWDRDRLGVPAEEVFRWMESWGGPNELSPPRPRRL